MAFLSHLNTAVSGLTAQRLRMDVISQNIANATTTETEEGGPYRRQVTLFGEVKEFKNINIGRNRRFGDILNMTLAERRELKNGGVQVAEVRKLEDEDSPFTPVYDPTHPHADEDGYYYLPNVDVAEEQLDLMAATHSYLNSLAVYDTLVQMAQRTIAMGRG
ncbi:MAG: flagellar basal body rod protein FlgC [Oscillospiraceae bacterium]|nr:flagellar basal body rod protein FlgC [Oscillospiraceae bacterium]